METPRRRFFYGTLLDIVWTKNSPPKNIIFSARRGQSYRSPERMCMRSERVHISAKHAGTNSFLQTQSLTPAPAGRASPTARVPRMYASYRTIVPECTARKCNARSAARTSGTFFMTVPRPQGSGIASTRFLLILKKKQVKIGEIASNNSQP